MYKSPVLQTSYYLRIWRRNFSKWKSSDAFSSNFPNPFGGSEQYSRSINSNARTAFTHIIIRKYYKMWLASLPATVLGREGSVVMRCISPTLSGSTLGFLGAGARSLRDVSSMLSVYSISINVINKTTRFN